nr:FAST kinase domain-containing protein 1, mitochondrial isoform X2 [Leptinotarsa decemlineata]
MSVHRSREEGLNFFFKDLHNHKEFTELLQAVSKHSMDFDSVLLSYLLPYLQKLDVSVESELIQSLSLKLRDELVQDFCLEKCSRLLRVIFTDNSVRPYYISLNLIPKVCQLIDEVSDVENLENLTICLNKLHNIVTDDVLEKYKDKILQFLKANILNSSHQSVILRIITFLTLPEWRNQCTILTSECMLLLKNKIHLLDIPQLLLLYEAFFKNQEPGDILDEIQRCAAKFWQCSEETSPLAIETRLRLLISLQYFSSPLHKVQFQKEARTFVKSTNSIGKLTMLQKLFTYVKISDDNLCKKYWRIYLNYLDTDKNIKNIVTFCQNYMYFNADVDFRHRQLEKKILEMIRKSVIEGDIISPSELAIFIKFTVIYGSGSMIDLLMRKLETNYSQFSAKDCFKISQSIARSFEVHNNFIAKHYVEKIKELMHQQTKNLLEIDDCDFQKNSLLICAAASRNDFHNFTIDSLFTKFKEMGYMSSKMLAILSKLMLSTDNLVPEIMNKCTEYIIEEQSKVVGFNAERILFSCYHLAYYPINADKFFPVVLDIIIRDQERFSGLTFIQMALSLCFFSRLPSFLVKQIFNVEFMDRLDKELAICYSKDTYPKRVRNTLMALNRAVCLEYPQFNIPWFHKSYVQDMERKYIRVQDNNVPVRIWEHLSELAGSSKIISQNVVTPYGYHIDFVVNLNKENNIVSSESEGIEKRVAVLLVHQKAFTRFYVHLKGEYQMKKRHLEILGYEVAVLKYHDWSNLLYSSERIDYLKDLIFTADSKSRKFQSER